VTHLDDMFTEAALPPSRNRGAVGKRLSGLVILGLIIAMVVIAWRLVAGDSAPTDYPGPGSGEVTVVVPRGATLTEIGGVLEQAGVVLTAEAFVEATANDERSSSLGPGSYSLLREMRAADALALMLSPQSRAENRLVLPEGLRMTQTFETAAEVTGLPIKDFEAVAKDPENLTGSRASCSRLPTTSWATRMRGRSCGHSSGASIRLRQPRTSLNGRARWVAIPTRFSSSRR